MANAARLRLIYSRPRKNDRADAEALARLARLDPRLLAPVRVTLGDGIDRVFEHYGRAGRSGATRVELPRPLAEVVDNHNVAFRLFCESVENGPIVWRYCESHELAG